MIKATLYLLTGILLAGTFLWIAASFVDIPGVRIVLGRVEIAPTMIIGLATVAFLGFKAWRWRRILGSQVAIGNSSAFRAVAIGSAANYLLPHFGELFRIWVVDKRGGIARSTVLATIGMERMLDLATVCLLGIGLIQLQTQSAYLQVAIHVLTAFCSLGFIVIGCALRFPEKFVAAIRLIFGVFGMRLAERVENLTRGALLGVWAAASPRELLQLFALSMLQWSCIAACVMASMSSVGFELSVGSAVAVLIALLVGLILPSAPGFAGTTQLAFLLALEPFGYDSDRAMAASIVYNITIVGVIFLVAMACSAGSVWRWAGNAMRS